MKKNKWIAEAGDVGCLSSFSTICDTKREAIVTITEMFDLAPHGRVAQELSMAGDTISARDESEHDLMHFQVYRVVPSDVNMSDWDGLDSDEAMC